jgi:integrase
MHNPPESERPQMPKGRRRNDYEGTLEQLPSGKFRYKGWLHGQSVCGSAAPTRSEAHRNYKAKLARLQSPPPPVVHSLPALADYVRELLDGAYQKRVARKTMAPTTWNMYEQVWRLKLSGTSLGNSTIDAITPEDINNWVDALMTERRVTKNGKVFPARPVSNTSKRRILGMLGAMYSYAIDQKKLQIKNPCEKAIKPPVDEVDFVALNAVEVEELLGFCDKEDPTETDNGKERVRRIASNRRRRLITLLGLHGFGPAEMCGLKREDFDGEGIEPCRQRQRLGPWGVTERDQLKTKERKQWVPLDGELAEMLNEMESGYVLEIAPGKPMEPSNLRRTFEGMVKSTKFQGMTPYDLRHTFAQRLLDENVDVKTAAELMRHSVDVFLERYVKSDKARKVAAMKKLQESRRRAKEQL